MIPLLLVMWSNNWSKMTIPSDFRSNSNFAVLDSIVATSFPPRSLQVGSASPPFSAYINGKTIVFFQIRVDGYFVPNHLRRRSLLQVMVQPIDAKKNFRRPEIALTHCTIIAIITAQASLWHFMKIFDKRSKLLRLGLIPTRSIDYLRIRLIANNQELQ